MGFWDKVKKALGGSGGGKDPPDPPDADGAVTPDQPPAPAVPATPAAPRSAEDGKRRPSNRVWRLQKRDGVLLLVAPHGTFRVKGIADDQVHIFDGLAAGTEVDCEGDFLDGSTISDLYVTKIRKPAPPAAAALAGAPAATARPAASSTTVTGATFASSGLAPPNQIGSDEDRYRASEILGLSQADLRKRAMRINPYRTAWIGRVDTIPPQTDERTAIIDRGLILRGLLTKEQIDEIHRIGDQWIIHHDAYKLADAAARRTADAAVAEKKAQKAALVAERKQQAAEREAERVKAIAARRATDIIYAGRGVSAGLADRRTHVEKLQAAGLPVLGAPSDLARALGLTIPQLRWLCFHAEASPKTHYVYFEVPKRSGGTRLLAAPHKRLATAQRWILDNILSKIDVTVHAHGFVGGRSTVTNARPHIGRDIVVNLDLENFFPTITFPRVRGLFASLGYSPAAATLLALICTESPRVKVLHDGVAFWVAAGERALPQGACTSPAISNLVTRKLDRRLAGACKKLGWTYTRYADDLTFSASGEAKAAMSLAMSRVRAIVRDEGFAINEAKGRVQRRARRQQVTGIVVNEKPGLPREEVRRLRAILHRAKTGGLAAQNRDNRPDFEAWLRGKIAYLAMIDAAKAAPLLAALDKLTT